MTKKTQLSPLGWIASIITVPAISLYFSSTIFYINNLFGAISTIIFIAFEVFTVAVLFFKLLELDFEDENHKLLIQLGCLHFIMQLITISITVIFYNFANVDKGGVSFIVLLCLIGLIIDILMIIPTIDWAGIFQNRKTKIGKFSKQITALTYKLKSKLITTKVIDTKVIDTESADKIKWK